MSNERLEFLGDAVLGLVVADYLFTTFSDRSEGWLSRARASLVRASTLHSVAQELSVGDAVRLGKGEKQSGGATKPSILADTVEALIGAVYLECGSEAARDFVLRLLGDRVDDLATRTVADGDPSPLDHKSRLQEWCARDGGVLPIYTWAESGPEHAKSFVVELLIEGVVAGRGIGRSKKFAEQDAARDALIHLETSPDEARTVFSSSEPE